MNHIKTKIISILILSTFIMPVVCAICEKDCSLNVSSVRYENGIFTANVETIRLEENGKAYFAIYDSNGALKRVACKPVNTGDSSFSFSTDEALEREKYKIKLMLWNENMVPDKNFYEGIFTDVVLESEHNYRDDYNKTSTFVYDGECKSIDVTFSEDTQLGDYFDYICIRDAFNKEVGGKYRGTELAGKTVSVPGNTVKIDIIADSDVTGYGYRTESIVVNK